MKKIQDLTENRNNSRGMDCTDFVQKLRIFAFWFQKLAFSPTFAAYDENGRNLVKNN